MNNQLNYNYHTNYSNFIGTRNGWHEYKFEHSISHPKILDGRSFAMLISYLHVKNNGSTVHDMNGSVPGYYNLQWFTTLDANSAKLDPPVLTWSYSDDIIIPSTFTEDNYPQMIKNLADLLFLHRLELKNRMQFLLNQKVSSGMV